MNAPADGHQSYFDAADWSALQKDHPIGAAFVDFATSISRDELFARQNRLFLKSVERAWTNRLSESGMIIPSPSLV